MLGKTEELVLLAVHKSGAKSTASEIFSVIDTTLSKTTGKSVAFGAIFTTLDRLAKKGLLKVESDVPRKDYGGRAPRLYTLSMNGVSELTSSLSVTSSLSGHFTTTRPALA